MPYKLILEDAFQRTFEIPEIGVTSIGRYDHKAEEWFKKRADRKGRCPIKNPIKSQFIEIWQAISKKHILLYRNDLQLSVYPEIMIPHPSETEFELGDLEGLIGKPSSSDTTVLMTPPTNQSQESLFYIMKDERENRTYLNKSTNPIIQNRKYFIHHGDTIMLGNYPLRFKTIHSSEQTQTETQNNQ